MYGDKISGLHDDLILPLDLIKNQFVITISFKVLYPYLLGELEVNKQDIALSYIIRIRFR